jgi:DNA-binding IclR family transcriptional regulator
MKPETSLERLLSVLEIFTEHRLEWTADDMMEQLGYARPTLYRYLKMLCESGLLVSHPQARYTLGPKIVELDYLLRLSDPLILAARPVLESLASQFRGTALLVRWYGDRMLCVDSVSSVDEQLSSYPRGRPMPLGRGAIARTILAHLPKAQAKSIISAHLSEWTDLGLGDSIDQVLSELRRSRRCGYAVAFEEVTKGVVGTAAPVLSQARVPIGAICLTMRLNDADEATLKDLSAAVPRAAGQISANQASR